MTWFTKFRHWLRFHLWYYRHPPWDTGISPPELHEFIEQNPAGRALDMGCGTGTNVITLAHAGWRVVGVDFVARAVHTAQRRVRQAGMSELAEVYVDDVTRLEGVTGSFNLILDIGCYHGLPVEAQAGYRRNVERLLAYGGAWLMYTRCRPESARALGISEKHIRRLQEQWRLEKRADGFDRMDVPAVWLTFRNEK
jgi:cyclopropane fatty-acyl-phospholipid synthase-like methyltransferase